VIHLVIPAYNEAPNLPRLLSDLAPVTRRLGARVILVDDGSADDTARVALQHASGIALEIVQHERNRGLGAAVASGLRHALLTAGADDPIVTLEADNTSSLDDLPAMLARFEHGYDVVLASVHADGGAIVGVARWRVAASVAVSDVFRVAGGMRQVHTLSGLYRVYRASALRRASQLYGAGLIREPGFAVNIELLLKLKTCGARICEVPTTNDWANRLGQSKMHVLPTLRAYGRVLVACTAELAQRPPVSDVPFPSGGDEVAVETTLGVVA
jgi:dolichol-phosphate mannosyltransferase